MRLIEALNYSPAELGFGTSGLRGLVTDMTDLECYINTSGFIRFLKSTSSLKAGEKIYVAGDLRDSTPRISAAVIRAITDEGLEPVYCGLIPTPALAYYAAQKDSACIMVTGSHIPADRNGIKFYKTNGEVLKEDEQAIKKNVTERRQQIYEASLEDSSFNASGALNMLPELPQIDVGAEAIFMQRFTQFGEVLKGKHIVVYQHSAVGRDFLVELLQKLGAKVTPVGRSDTFISIDTENVTPQNKGYFRSLAEQYPDNFAIVSTDGDSDRPFVIDERGEFHRGDIVGCVVAKELGADAAAVPISCNDAGAKYLEENGIKAVYTKIGSPYVISGMKKSADANTVVGWEVNGGFMMGSEATLHGVNLKPLPTRDAILPIVAVLTMAVENSKKVSEIFEVLPKRYTGAALLDNVDEQAIVRIRDLPQDQAAAEAIIERELKSRELGEPINVNRLDGLRVTFSSGNVIHIRPSGNAPQLRIYTNTDSQDYADSLAAQAVAPGGLLERFVNSIANN